MFNLLLGLALVFCCRCDVLTLMFFFFIFGMSLVSTLFPYTTLFRSCDRARNRCRALPRDAASHVVGRARRPRDRKSTRLNSSHVAISYAVFCLKKKKNLWDVGGQQF